MKDPARYQFEWSDYDTEVDPRNALLRDSDVRSGLCRPKPPAERIEVPLYERGPQGMQATPSDAAMLAALIKLSQGGSQTPSIHLSITDSFNTTDSHNRRYRYHQQLESNGLVRPSKVIPPLFAGFWLMSVMILLVSGVSSND